MWFKSFNDLVITGPGEYVMRDGHRAVVEDTKLLMSYPFYGWHPDGYKTWFSFNYQVDASGYVYIPTKNRRFKEVWTHWSVDGRIVSGSNKPNDIVRKVKNKR